MEPMNGLDAAFLALETPTMHMHVCAVMILETAEDAEGQPPAFHFERMCALFEERLHLVPALRRRALRVPFGLQHPFWIEDPHFDIDFHLRRASLPRPGGFRELNAFAAEVASRPLDPGRPLWEMHIVEGLESGHVAVVSKLHHALIDGESGAEVMATFMDLGPQMRMVDQPRQPRHHEAIPSGTEILGQAVSSIASQSERAISSLKRTFGVVKDLAERNRRLREEEELDPPPAPFKAPRTSLNGSISPHRRFATFEAPLEDLKELGRQLGATVNDVVLAVVSGALRRLLEERGEHAPDLVAMVPMSVRGEHERQDHGNRLSAMLVSLQSSSSEPLARIERIVEGTRLAKEQARMLPADLVQGWAQLAFPAFSSRLARLAGNLRLFDRLPPLFNVVVSNIAGPDFALWCAGNRLVAVYPIGPIIEGVGLNVTVFSYGGTLYFGLTGCRELVPEVEHLAHLASDALAALAKAAAQEGAQGD